MRWRASAAWSRRQVPQAALSTLENACAQATARGEYKTIAARLNVDARYLPGDAFRNLFAADSIENAEAVQRAGLAMR